MYYMSTDFGADSLSRFLFRANCNPRLELGFDLLTLCLGPAVDHMSDKHTDVT